MAQLVDCIDERPVLLTGGAMLTVSCVVLLVAPQRVGWLAVSLRLAGVGRTARDIAELRDSLTDSPWAAPIESVHGFCRRSIVAAWSPTTTVEHDLTADAAPSRVVVGLVLLVGNLAIPATVLSALLARHERKDLSSNASDIA